jgi:hypothetical protein
MIYVTSTNEKGSRRRAVEMTELMENAETQKAGFPRFPQLLGNLANGARFPHSHSFDDGLPPSNRRPDRPADP